MCRLWRMSRECVRSVPKKHPTASKAFGVRGAMPFERRNCLLCEVFVTVGFCLVLIKCDLYRSRAHIFWMRRVTQTAACCRRWHLAYKPEYILHLNNSPREEFSLGSLCCL